MPPKNLITFNTFRITIFTKEVIEAQIEVSLSLVAQIAICRLISKNALCNILDDSKSCLHILLDVEETLDPFDKIGYDHSN